MIKVMLLIGRGQVTRLNKTVDNLGKFTGLDTTPDAAPQRLQMEGFFSETLTSVERAQEYGFETYPISGDTSEAIAAFINGNRDNGIVLCVKDDQFRPTDLDAGDVVVYGKADKDAQKHRVHFKANGDIELYAGDAVITTVGGLIAIGNTASPMTSTPPLSTGTELLEIVDRLLTVLQGVTNLAGLASTPSFLPTVITELGKLQADLGNIKGSL